MYFLYFFFTVHCKYTFWDIDVHLQQLCRNTYIYVHILDIEYCLTDNDVLTCTLLPF
jgi:hypothetical protein